MLLKNVLNRDGAKEPSIEDKGNDCVESTVKHVYKTIWKLKYI